jgi:hypothetical protein
MGLREFFESPKGKPVALGILGVGIVAAAISIWQNIGGGEAEAIAGTPSYINAKTGEVRKIKMGKEAPPADFYPAESCYWTKDGKVKEQPTLVLLNTYKGSKDPTFCPDCGRLVVQLNPPANINNKPPPTQAEYKQRRGESR